MVSGDEGATIPVNITVCGDITVAVYHARQVGHWPVISIIVAVYRQVYYWPGISINARQVLYLLANYLLPTG